MLGCNVYSDGSAAAIDTWNPSSTKTNVLDQDQVNKTQCHVILSNIVQFGCYQHRYEWGEGSVVL